MFFRCTFYTHSAPYQYTPIPMFHSWYYTVSVVVLGRSKPNMLEPHLIQTNLFQTHLNKEHAAIICQASFHVQSLILQVCDAL